MTEKNTDYSDYQAHMAKAFASVQETAHINIEMHKEYYNKHARLLFSIVSTKVIKCLLKIEPCRTKFGPRYEEPFIIIQKRGHANYKIAQEGSRNSQNVHVNKLKPF